MGGARKRMHISVVPKRAICKYRLPCYSCTELPLRFFSSPNDRSFCSLEGKWNGVKYAKYSTGGHTVFTETKKLLVIRRKVGWKNRTEYESHYLCKAVSLDLNIRDVDAAIEARHKREERQRAEA